MRKNISIIMSILAIAVAGFTLFRNPDQIPYGATLPVVQEGVRLDTVIVQEVEGVMNREPHRIYRVVFEREHYITVAQVGLPTYDSIMIPRTDIRNVLQYGAFSKDLFLEHTKGATKVVRFDRLR